MLRKLFFVEDIMERYNCRTKDTARRYMRQMGASGHPLMVTEDMINAWEDRKMTPHAKRQEMKIPGRKVG